ncbi:30S ribosomal protein S7 [Candidatus Roizmanbacteria bacterium RIFOXYB2_FULL_38_10]|uniref:Small ribosomal subunit protein uS7 n=1 Tax=Candidatus Roizmanbacteria bacterium RIFOXYD1_FULL_38_12 TaxID=1802093 RepID=A0A1F7KZB7_9BACT|nr:MAG: 30S ribosomal protein S7 [Candidatus Roizmanbacteria bacterium RIFOXYA2_FULL_38_14]OGK63205.1 MAG: 30S ribosomal protein S7 [Candidatus Roizmanbacteria bacterium RIFOXYA1_FULL_37_12]OGK65051.1 MAG: 30S ribosomal protein S7 [Candidatus Roizmanbacteria bacterium RIFOXYB1_FULL_40_23]OGK68606.1 MAG: 30S ribosomal protein S7 [Candidatus Roizmanbacteria bacterium RIFOXYB2_FULL_38_10]OGK69454.1 MAG: 30S ribosomal protein S7 [Candidatus Roizmanbacteria bacterium RIFOXYC1_FULL_38_14]OGK72965.1 
MPRHQYKKLTVQPDPIYGSFEVAKLINFILRDGKKTTAEKIVYGVLERLKKEGQDAIKILNQAISNVSPNHEVKPKRLGGASYLVPIEVRKERKLFLSLNWIVTNARAKSNKEFHSFEEKLYTEIKDAAQNQGPSIAKKAQTEKLAEANKAFAHLKW